MLCGRDRCELVESADPPAYAYLLGMYLGDGHIVQMRNGVHRLMITCCDEYPKIMDACEQALRVVLPYNRTSRAQRIGCTTVGVYSNHLQCLFPQHGPGKKSDRSIALTDWQNEIVAVETKHFLKGLLDSDGCRCINRIKVGHSYREYPRYFFSNRSPDILRLFTDSCDLLGIEWRQNLPWSISVARRSSVEALDEFVGPKA